MRKSALLLLPFALLAALPGCSKSGHDHAGHAHGGHAHTAPHGGKLVELGEHAYNLEVVSDAAAGKLTLYVLDGHAEKFIRIKAPMLDAIATVGTEKRPLVFRAIASSATGETVGDTTQFEAQAEWLKTTPTFEAVIPQIEIRGTKFDNVALPSR